MIGSFEDDHLVIRMSRNEASCLLSELFYTIDYRPEQYPEYADLSTALHQGLNLA